MTILTVDFVQSNSVAGLKADLAAALLAGKQPQGDMFIDPETGLLTWAVVTGTEDGTFEDVLARVDVLEAYDTANTTYRTNLNTTLIDTNTKLNTMATKLNADAGVTDTNYAATYDTNPQA